MADLLWARCRGRDGWSSPVDIPEDMAAEARNWHRYEGSLGSKRAGSTAQSLTGDSHTGYNALFRFVPGQDDTAAELLIVSADGTPKILRVAAGTAKANLTLKDNIASRAWDVSSAVLNGKLYLAYDSTVNRLHVFDPALSTTTVRRAGHATPAAPSVADTGSGTYTATARYYRIRWRTKSGSTLQRQGLPSPSTAFTPSGSGTAARITQPTVPSEGETHWVVEVSLDNATFYELAETAIATTTYDDSASTTTYADNEAAPSEGAYTPFPSVKYLATDGNRLLGYGVWETSAGDSMTPRAGRVFFTPVLDSSDYDDDERVSNTTTFKGWIDITRNANSADRGLSPRPVDGAFYTFQSRGINMLVPTGNATTPYRRVPLTSELGAVNNQSIVIADDKEGSAWVYFLDPELGPHRVKGGRIQRCGKDVQDVWDTINLGATGQVAWGTYFKPLNLVLFGIATGSSNDPDTILAFDVTEGVYTDDDGVRGGWFVWDGNFAASRCAVQFAESMGATMGRTLTTYVGRNSGTSLLRYDDTATDDAGTAFRAYVRSRAFEGQTLPKNKTIANSYLLATAETSVNLQQAWVRNFGDETNRTDTVSLTPTAAGESRVLRRYESPDLIDAYCFQVELGDASATASAFALERWWCDYNERELRTNP